MGGTLSSGVSNEDLVDNLVSAKYIFKPEIEQVFRAVDRGLFFPADSGHPYRDTACKADNFHISSPSIYTLVLQHLDLQKGKSFLNLGSGTGYLSTMAGLLLGSNGINHGVEIFEDVVEHANDVVTVFMAKTDALDKFDFCRPEFTVGNCQQLPPGTAYDRIYCGAGCSESELDYFKSLVKVDGILIAPVESELMVYSRPSENEWISRSLLPVAFSPLLPATGVYLKEPVLPSINVKSLQETAILLIRELVRRKVYAEHAEFGLDKMCTASAERIRKKRLKTRDCEIDPEMVTLDSRVFLTVTHRVKWDSGIVDDFDDELDYGEYDPDDDVSCDLTYSFSRSNDESIVAATPSFSALMTEKIKTFELPKQLLVALIEGNRYSNRYSNNF